MPVMFATPEEAELAFYDALERADLARLMQVWSDDEEIICVHPGGLRMVGLHAVKESWQEILMQGALHIRPAKLVTTQSMMSTVHSLIEQITVRSQAGTEVAHCYATNVYHKGPTGWRMVMHHASAAPEQTGLLDSHDAPGLLH
ncbi:MAG: nuclear transport factor 2 family protein [Candidatus Methylopumilus sp.]|nr:nuclear transport factor 2 family protein [Candidatus Methylopumilus sp.]